MSDTPDQRECKGCGQQIPTDQVKCLICGTYREDIQDRLVWWWTIKVTQVLVLAVLIYLVVDGYWSGDAGGIQLQSMASSPLFWSILAIIFLLEPGGMYYGLRLYKDTGVGFYKWMG